MPEGRWRKKNDPNYESRNNKNKNAKTETTGWQYNNSSDPPPDAQQINQRLRRCTLKWSQSPSIKVMTKKIWGCFVSHYCTNRNRFYLLRLRIDDSKKKQKNTLQFLLVLPTIGLTLSLPSPVACSSRTWWMRKQRPPFPPSCEQHSAHDECHPNWCVESLPPYRSPG